MKYIKITTDGGDVFYENNAEGYIFQYVEGQEVKYPCSPEQFYRFVPVATTEPVDTLL